VAAAPDTRLPPPATWDEYSAGVAAWLSRHWGPGKECPYCGSPDWQIGPVVEIRRALNWPAEEGDAGGFIPGVPVSSVKCGHIVFINALWIFEAQEARQLWGSFDADPNG
jgi:hypothetical protein